MQKQVDKLEKIFKEATKENKVRFEVITQLLLLKPDLVSGMSSNRKLLLLIKKKRGWKILSLVSLMFAIKDRKSGNVLLDLKAKNESLEQEFVKADEKIRSLNNSV